MNDRRPIDLLVYLSTWSSRNPPICKTKLYIWCPRLPWCLVTSTIHAEISNHLGLRASPFLKITCSIYILRMHNPFFSNDEVVVEIGGLLVYPPHTSTNTTYLFYSYYLWTYNFTYNYNYNNSNYSWISITKTNLRSRPQTGPLYFSEAPATHLIRHRIPQVKLIHSWDIGERGKNRGYTNHFPCEGLYSL